MKALPNSLPPVILTVVLLFTVSPVDSVRHYKPAGGIIQVGTTIDELTNNGVCSLREAIQAALHDAPVDACPAGQGADVIILPAGLYSLEIGGSNEDHGLTGDLDILSDLTLQGAGAEVTIIDGNGDTLGDRVIHIHGTVVTLADLTVGGGFAVNGGGVLNDGGNLTLTRSQVIYNAAPNGGGGIHNLFGTLIANDTFVGFNATNSSGGGIDNAGGTLTLIGSAVMSNVVHVGGAAGIYSVMIMGIPATATIVDTVVSHNTAKGSGAGVVNAAAVMTITRSLIANNHADGFDGGGLVTGHDFEPTITIVINSTFSGNTAKQNGGAIYNTGTLHLRSVTVTGNMADADANGSGNGGGLFSSGTLILTHSLIAGNLDLSPGVKHPDCSGQLLSGGHNLIQDTSNCFLMGATANDLLGVMPLLGPLMRNGGPTQTHALLDGSPAIDAGAPAGCTDYSGLTLSTDQRGFMRITDGDGDGKAVCDIGAYELWLPTDWIFLPIILH